MADFEQTMNITSAVKLVLWFGICFFLGYIFTVKAFGETKQLAGNTGLLESKAQEAIKCTAGYCQLEGTLFADPALGAKRFELPETSTPTVKTTRATIWLHGDDDGGHTLKVIFPNGTIVDLAAD